MTTLTKREKEILAFIKRRKITSPVVIQALFKMPRLAVQETLNMLWRLDFITRPVRGLVCHKEYLVNHPDQVEALEKVFKCTIPV